VIVRRPKARGVVVTQFEQRGKGVHRAKSIEIGLSAQTGKTLWETTLGAGKVPPRNKDAVPMIAGESSIPAARSQRAPMPSISRPGRCSGIPRLRSR